MPNVIEKSARSVIVQGLVDFVIIAEGTRYAVFVDVHAPETDSIDIFVAVLQYCYPVRGGLYICPKKFSDRRPFLHRAM